jgi:SLT domain-containing protein
VTQAVQTAIAKEGVPKNWEAGLHYIIQRESTGKVGSANSTDSARGLFQLTKSSYHLNPHGAASFGNAVEEAQGGIRYIAQRYQTAENAVGFWKKHGWY